MPPKFNYIHHASLPSSNLNEAELFYNKLGFSRIPRPSTLPNQGIWLQQNKIQLHLIYNHNLKKKPEDNIHLEKRHFALSVEDIFETYDLMRKMHIKTSNISEIETNKFQFFFLDNDNNSIEINNY